MKATGHPQYHPQAQVSCACGNLFTIGSTRNPIKVEVCFKCHPFYTGEMKYVDTLGRVERFQKRQKAAVAAAPILAAKKLKKQHKTVEKAEPKTLREMLLGT